MRRHTHRVLFPKGHLNRGGDRASMNHTSSLSVQRKDMDVDSVPHVEPYLREPPLLTDSHNTPTSDLQNATLAECLPLLNGLNNPSQNPFDYDERGVKQLNVESHIAFAEDALAPYPAPFVALDASRPWMVYWALTALHFLGEDVRPYESRVIKTFSPLQNKIGGYGGGQGHYSHLAGTYATLLSIAIVGGKEAYELTDRRAMWSWLGRLKQADGGFQICEGGEEDTRAAYCALLIIALLGLPWDLPSDSPARMHGLETFGDRLGEHISKCQTYEGGISSEPGTEAHGAYTFCALAALCLLDAPHVSIPKYLDIDRLIHWLSSRQYAPEGGFAGRTNKLVDGCYSHWIGDCFPLVQAALNGPAEPGHRRDVGDLYSTEGLSRYILNCCQSPDGGLRDKPSKAPDSYHTCYTLAGLSNCEYVHYYTAGGASIAHTHMSYPGFNSAFRWEVVHNKNVEQKPGYSNYTENQEHAIDNLQIVTARRFDSGCSLNAVHPVFVIPHEAVTRMQEWAINQPKLTD